MNMEPMSDKKLDQLFKDKFEGAEFEPSADLWGKIEKQLETPKKRSFPVMWMAAASITITVGGFLMFDKAEKMPLQLDSQQAQIHNQQAQTSPKDIDQNSLVESVETTVPSYQQNASLGNTQASLGNAQKNISNTVQPSEVSARHEYRNEQASNAAQQASNVRYQASNVAQQAISGSQGTTSLAQQGSSLSQQASSQAQEALSLTQETFMVTSAPVQVGLTDEQPNTIKTEFAIEHEAQERDIKQIKDVGSLVNYVVDKVDRRDQKLLKFSPDEDDNMRLVGINIGLLKWNKKNK